MKIHKAIRYSINIRENNLLNSEKIRWVNTWLIFYMLFGQLSIKEKVASELTQIVFIIDIKNTQYGWFSYPMKHSAGNWSGDTRRSGDYKYFFPLPNVWLSEKWLYYIHVRIHMKIYMSIDNSSRITVPNWIAILNVSSTIWWQNEIRLCLSLSLSFFLIISRLHKYIFKASTIPITIYIYVTFIPDCKSILH